ncbi:MAG: hypothetical protein AAF593_01250 [Planctomycetota bacterium]
MIYSTLLFFSMVGSPVALAWVMANVVTRWVRRGKESLGPSWWLWFGVLAWVNMLAMYRVVDWAIGGGS